MHSYYLLVHMRKIEAQRDFKICSKFRSVSGRSGIQTQLPLTLWPVLSTIKSSLTISIGVSETILAVTFHQHDLMGSAKRWCLPCQLLLTPEFLTPLPKLRPELQAHPTPHTPHSCLVSVSSHFLICDLIVGSLFPHYPSTSFTEVLLTQIGLWSMLTWASPRASLLLWNSDTHSLMQIISVASVSRFWSLLTWRYSFWLCVSSLQHKY